MMRATIGTVPDTHPDPITEAWRLLADAQAVPVTIRLIGGVGVGLRCPSAARPPLSRPYKDLDFVGRSSESAKLQAFFTGEGYAPDRRFNLLNGHRRLLFRDEGRSRQLDVVLDRFEMCHRFDVRDRLEMEVDTLPLADLLLTKLQVVQANEKDLLDCLALLVDHPVTVDSVEGIDARYVARLCARDWGLWRTLHLNRERVEEYASRLDAPERATTVSRLGALFDRIDQEPKSLAWKLRARIGDRMQWYELPEEVG
jgi:hypothetical protein